MDQYSYGMGIYRVTYRQWVSDTTRPTRAPTLGRFTRRQDRDPDPLLNSPDLEGPGDWRTVSMFLNLNQAQNPIDEPAIKQTVLAALAKKPCVDFANAVLAAQRRKGLGALTKVAEDFFALSGPRFTRNRPQNSSLGVANPIGKISTGTAQIYSLGNDSLLTAAEQMLNDSDHAISELFHFAAQGDYYSDEELAKAVHKSTYGADAYALKSDGQPLIDPRSNIFDPRYIPDKKDKHHREHSYSKYFHAFKQDTVHRNPDSRGELASSRKLWRN